MNTLLVSLIIACLLIVYMSGQLYRQRRRHHRAEIPDETMRAALRQQWIAYHRQTGTQLKEEAAHLTSAAIYPKEDLKEAVRESAARLHQWAESLVPFTLLREGLMEVIVDEVTRFEERHKTTVDLAVSAVTRYAEEDEWLIYQLVRTLLRRSEAATATTHVEMHLGLFGRHVMLQYRDDTPPMAYPTTDSPVDQQLLTLIYLLQAKPSVHKNRYLLFRIPVRQGSEPEVVRQGA